MLYYLASLYTGCFFDVEKTLSLLVKSFDFNKCLTLKVCYIIFLHSTQAASLYLSVT